MQLSKGILKLSSAGLIAVLCSQTYAAGYRLEFQSASALADAGDAAVVEDASTNWYNSAGLVYLPRQVVFGGVQLYERTKFTGSAVAPSPFPAPIGPLFSYSGHGSATSYPHPFIPLIHYNIPILKDRVNFGLSVVPAWGLMEEYGENSVARYDLTRVFTRTIDIAPSIAIKVTDHWSVGMGPDYHYFTIQEKDHARTQGPAAFGGTTGDSISRIVASRWNYGGHVGVLYRYDDHTRVGFNYRARMVMNLDGYSSFVFDNITTFETHTFHFKIPLPPTMTLSAYHDINPCWSVMASVAYDQWSSIRNLHGFNYITPPTPTNPSGKLQIVIGQHNRDTIDYSFGTRYKINPKLMLRTSFKYNGTPTVNKYRDLNFPDGEKYGINFGARYQVTKCLAVDGIYAHVFTKKVPIHPTEAVTNVALKGHATTNIDLLGAQVVFDF